MLDNKSGRFTILKGRTVVDRRLQYFKTYQLIPLIINKNNNILQYDSKHTIKKLFALYLLYI